MPRASHIRSRGDRGLAVFLALAVVLSLGLLTIAPPAEATTTTVTTEAEYKGALTALSSDTSGPHTIVLGADITFASTGYPTYSGSEDLTIDGNGYTIDANDQRPTRGLLADLEPADGVTITLQDVTITGGSTNRPGGTGGGVAVRGGALVVESSTISDNTSNYDDAGGVYTTGDLTITDSVVSSNHAQDIGGVSANGSVLLVRSTIAGNDGSQNDLIGGVFGYGVTLINSTVTENGGGGGVMSRGGIGLIHATISGNLEGPNIKIQDGYGSTTLTSFGSVVSDPATVNCALPGTTTSASSYDDDGTCGFADSTDTSNGSDPLLGALADNGGPTLTMLPAEGSPLIDAVECRTDITVDQRGVARPQGLGCDIGAVEVVAAIPYESFDLIADGGSADTAIDVGEVRVWDDCSTLSVQYLTDVPDWRIASIALDVEGDSGDIPQTKKGNPIPGAFEVQDSFPYPWVTETPVYEFDLTGLSGAITIAAHADLWDYASTEEVTFSSSDYGTDDVYGFGRFDEYTEGVSGLTPVAISTVPKNPAWVTGLSSAWITIADGTDPTIDQWFRVDHTIDVPGPVFGDGTIVANSDNAETVLNGDFVSGWNGDVVTVPVPSSERGAFVTDSTYTFPATAGLNTIEFLVRNYTPPNPENPGDNPMALIYEGSVSYHDRSETGWGDGDRFVRRGNWATYMTYDVGTCTD